MFRIDVRKLVRKLSGSSVMATPSRPTIKLRLEELEGRTLPSASTSLTVNTASPEPAPAATAIISDALATINQGAELLATFEQNLVTDVNWAGQLISQEVASIEHDLGSLFGINPISYTAAPNNTVSQPGNGNVKVQGPASGSGSGSSASPDQAIISGQGSTKPQPVTSGSGSGIATPEASGLPGTVKGEVWLDNNGDGSIDNHELGYVGATVNLYYNDSGTWDMFATTTTTSDNPTLNYSMQITVPYPNSEFELQVVFPWSFEATIPGTSQINAQGYTQPFYLSAGGTVQKTAGLRSMNVNTTADDPNGPTQPNTVTLRDVIQTGNNGPPNPAVTFYTAPNTQLSGTISLQASLPAIATSYNIDGPGAATLAVNGNNTDAIFTVNAGVNSTISDLTIEDGSNGNGGGVRNSGNTVLIGDTIASNQTTGNGGGIDNGKGSLRLTGDQIVGNAATGAGGGLYNAGGTVTITVGTVFTESSIRKDME